MNFILVGAGGHAKEIVASLRRDGHVVAQYVDPVPAEWLGANHVRNDADTAPKDGAVAMGIGGTGPKALKHRLALLDGYIARGFAAPPIIHQTAIVSEDAVVGDGAVILAGAIIQPGAVLERGVIVNTAAIVEHDSIVGAGSHLAPRSMLLGGCKVGATAMVGAGAVILPGSEVGEGQTVAALSRHPH